MTQEYRLDYQAGEGPTLKADGHGETWNGWSVPIATAGAVRTWMYENAANDPNGEWAYVVVQEKGGALCLTQGDEDVERWESCGAGLYLLEGWTFVPAEG